MTGKWAKNLDKLTDKMVNASSKINAITNKVVYGKNKVIPTLTNITVINEVTIIE